jgi:hypothetical protein
MTTASCATMFNGSKETINVRSEQPDTRFFMNERDLGRGTSATTTINKKQLGKAILRAEKEGCNSKQMPLATQFDATTLLGFLIDFGIVTILVVDWMATGAVTKAAQNDYVLTPECPRKTGQLLQSLMLARALAGVANWSAASDSLSRAVAH